MKLLPLAGLWTPSYGKNIAKISPMAMGGLSSFPLHSPEIIQRGSNVLKQSRQTTATLSVWTLENISILNLQQMKETVIMTT